jgi:hypothetical protein
MAENQKSIDGIIEKLAMIVDAADELFPDGKMLLAFELKEVEFKKVQENFREIDKAFKQFKIEMSGNDIMFLLDESSNV